MAERGRDEGGGRGGNAKAARRPTHRPTVAREPLLLHRPERMAGGNTVNTVDPPCDRGLLR